MVAGGPTRRAALLTGAHDPRTSAFSVIEKNTNATSEKALTHERYRPVKALAINNNILIVAGSLVGAAGIILTNIMCRAMNRSLANVLFSGFGAYEYWADAPGHAEGCADFWEALLGLGVMSVAMIAFECLVTGWC